MDDFAELALYRIAYGLAGAQRDARRMSLWSGRSIPGDGAEVLADLVARGVVDKADAAGLALAAEALRAGQGWV